MKPVARAIVGNLVWSVDGGVWAWWEVAPLPYGRTPQLRRDGAEARLRRLVEALSGTPATLLSVCEQVDGATVAAAMAAGVDVARHPAWAEACTATGRWLADVAVYRRRHYLGVGLAPVRAPWRDLVRAGAAEVAAVFGLSPLPLSATEVDAFGAQAAELEAALAAHVRLRRVSAGELCWLPARALGRAPSYDLAWEPHGALRAHPLEALVTEGAGPDLTVGDRRGSSPLGSRSVRVDGVEGTSWHTTLVLTDLTDDLGAEPGAGGPGRAWLFDVDDVGFPVDWCVRWNDGAATVLLSLTAPTLDELDERVDELLDRHPPRDHRVARPVRGQLDLLRATLPGAAASRVVEPQRIEPAELAAAMPFGSREVGDARGALLGLSLDGGTGTPVLFDPSSLGAVGSPGSGLSYLFKRLVWDTVARGGQAIVIDRSPDGEHAAFAGAVFGGTRVVRVRDGRPRDLDLAADDMVVLWAPLADDTEVAELVRLAMRVVGADPARFGAVVVEDAGPVLENAEGRAVLAGALRRGARGNAGLWLGAETPDQLRGDDLAGVAARFVFDQAAEDIPAALRWLGFDPEDPGSDDTLASLAVGLDLGQCLLRDSRGRVGLVQVVPPLIPRLQDALEAEADQPLPLAEAAAP